MRRRGGAEGWSHEWRDIGWVVGGEAARGGAGADDEDEDEDGCVGWDVGMGVDDVFVGEELRRDRLAGGEEGEGEGRLLELDMVVYSVS